jgi:nucleotidyltransferase/DNA polymerase involved in DNA repair
MTQATLRTVTLETIANYRQVAEHAVGAYRASGHRLLAVMEKGVDRTATRGAERVAPQLAAALRRTGGKVSSVAAKGIDTVSTQTERVIQMSSQRVTEQVSRVADIVEGIENKYVATGLQAAARLSLVGAQAALTLSGKLAEGAVMLSGAVTPTPEKAAKVVVKRANAATAAKSAVKTTAKRVTKQAVKAVAAEPVIKAVRARRSAAAKTA